VSRGQLVPLGRALAAILLIAAIPLFAGALLRSDPAPAGDPAGADPIDAEDAAAWQSLRR
jgi:hypothetical protein